MAANPPVRVLIPTGFGINCESETAYAFKLAGAQVQALHLNDLFETPDVLMRFQILALAGGFSFGDHLGSGRVLANRLRTRSGKALERYLANGGLVIGICNGFQTIVRLGLLPGNQLGLPRISLAPNRKATFYDGWVTLAVDKQSPCVFTRGLPRMELPVRHGEGRIVCSDDVANAIETAHLIPVRYADPATGDPTDRFPLNPNGSVRSAAGICDASGRVFGLMPHPEAFLYPENHPDWRHRKTPGAAGVPDGQLIFQNAVREARKFL